MAGREHEKPFSKGGPAAPGKRISHRQTLKNRFRAISGQPNFTSLPGTLENPRFGAVLLFRIGIWTLDFEPQNQPPFKEADPPASREEKHPSITKLETSSLFAALSSSSRSKKLFGPFASSTSQKTATNKGCAGGLQIEIRSNLIRKLSFPACSLDEEKHLLNTKIHCSHLDIEFKTLAVLH